MAYDDSNSYTPLVYSDDDLTPSQQMAKLVSPADAASLMPGAGMEPSSNGSLPMGSSPSPSTGSVSAPSQPAIGTPSPSPAPYQQAISGRGVLTAIGPPPVLDAARMQQLQQQRNSDATPLNPKDAQYRPGLGTKVLRGLGAYFAGGLGGAFLQNYNAPNRQYATDEVARQARLGQDNAQIGDLEKNYEDKLKGYKDSTEYGKQVRLLGQGEDTNATVLAKNGLKQDVDPVTGKVTVSENPDSEFTKRRVAQDNFIQAKKEFEDAQTQLAKARTDALGNPNSPAFKLAQQRVSVAAQNAQTAAGRLGLSGQEFSFDQDKFYNPQPTATERRTGDLAQSAVERIGEMRSVMQKHPEYFGPAAGRGTNFQEWLGSQDPDAQTFLSARQYLTDHSAGVFGGRGKYITQELGKLTDPKMNAAAMGASLDEAERAARGFVTAGTVHHAPQGNAGAPAPASAQQPGQIPAAAASHLQEGVQHTFGNGQVWTKQNGKPVRVN